jgi:hypothetical protein
VLEDLVDREVSLENEVPAVMFPLRICGGWKGESPFLGSSENVKGRGGHITSNPLQRTMA